MKYRSGGRRYDHQAALHRDDGEAGGQDHREAVQDGVQEDRQGEEPALPGLLGGEPHQHGEGDVGDEGRAPLHHGQKVGGGRGAGQGAEDGLDLGQHVPGEARGQLVGQARVDHHGHDEVAGVGEAQHQDALDAAVARPVHEGVPVVVQPAFQHGLEGQEPARFFKQARHKPAVEGVEQGVPHDLLPHGQALEHDVVDQGLQYEGEDDEHGAADEEGQHLGAPLLIIEQEHEGRPEGEHHGRGHERHGQGRHAHSRTVPSLAGPTIFTAVP